MNPASVIVLAAVLVLVALALRAAIKKGGCSCGSGGCTGDCASCRSACAKKPRR
ncbi:MAG: FeoB-associated Cys-rich membrane protein [Oscillospiraceae bacterium]|nr:FeoB-associated Cys-rich membrane protein [Oscillospiraceae bacterium]